MRKKIILCLLGASVFLSAGCSSRMADLTAISSKNVRGLDYVERARVKGEDCSHIILIFPTGFPDLKEAINDTLGKGNGDLLVDATLYDTFFYIPPFYGQSCYKVEGTVVDTMEKAVKKEIK